MGEGKGGVGVGVFNFVDSIFKIFEVVCDCSLFDTI
jgi:hypothetical protein